MGQLDAQKTYNRILGVQEARLAREALKEKRALAITRRFLQEQDEREKLQSAPVRCEQEDSPQRLFAVDDAGRQKIIEKEERDHVLDFMRGRSQQREEEAARMDAEFQERQQWVQARHTYDKLQAQKRSQLMEEALAERRTQVESRMEERDARLKARQEERHQEVIEKEKARQREKERALAAQRQRLAEGQRSRLVANKNCAQKRTDAAQRRSEKQEKIARDNREAAARRDERLAEVRQKEEQQRKEACEKLQAKLGRIAAFEQERQAAGTQAQQAAAEGPPRMAKRDDIEQEKADRVWKKLQEKNAGNDRTRAPFWSQDVADATAQAGKDYVQRRADLEQAAMHMHATKNFKVLADVAKTSEREEPVGKSLRARAKEDRQTARMRHVHKMLTARSGRDEPLQAAGRHTARLPHDQPCALCGREFPLQNLEGKFFSKAVERFKQERLDGPDAPKSCPPPDKSGTAGVVPERVAQYDHEVRLCGKCTCVMRSRHL